MINTITHQNTYTVYMHICPNGKRYIGITQQSPKKRWEYGQGYRNNHRFSKAIQKYGWDNVRHIILYSGLTKDMAEDKEIELINKYKSNKIMYGYNIDNGGSTSGNHSKATCKKISEAKKGQMAGSKHWHYGQHWGKEVRKKMSEAHRKKVKCVETGIVYISVREAGKKMNLSTGDISKCCRGIKYHNTVGGYHWEFAKEIA